MKDRRAPEEPRTDDHQCVVADTNALLRRLADKEDREELWFLKAVLVELTEQRGW